MKGKTKMRTVQKQKCSIKLEGQYSINDVQFLQAALYSIQSIIQSNWEYNTAALADYNPWVLM